MASSMYRMKPLFDPYAKIEIMTDMYRMKNLHDHDARSDPVSTEIVSNGSAEDDDFVKFLEGRQEELLKRLDKLRQLLSEPIVTPGASPKKIPTSNQGSKMTVQAVDLVKLGLSQDVVFNVNPAHPPHSLLGLAKLWSGTLDFNVTCHTHSSVRNLPKPAAELQEKLAALAPGKAPACLNIRLVWKEVDGDACFVISPLKSVPISGEVNFLRFLNSCVAGKLGDVEQTILDDRLDSCHAISVATVPKSELRSHHQNVFEGLKTSKWLSGDQPSILDVACWSLKSRDGEKSAAQEEAEEAIASRRGGGVADKTTAKEMEDAEIEDAGMEDAGKGNAGMEDAAIRRGPTLMATRSAQARSDLLEG
ncbi:unnamed protein product [Nesidiocoris tenuis]|uniref:AIMP2 thioredoxin-like domain-containing protein n=1 Tax=Nesidiocoris tenuis TaxID=355587 RepID=A0A6H5GG82_9HEMI|nr:unnamed protein product [Nesidiocoris tenuis]